MSGDWNPARDEQKAAEAAQRQVLQDFRDTFGSEQGRRALRHLIEVYGILDQSHVRGDPHETAFRDGQRKVVLDVLDMIGRRTSAEFLQTVYE